MNYALVHGGVVVNVVVLDNPADFTPPTGHTLAPIQDGFWIGDHFADGVFSPAPLPPAPFNDLSRPAFLFMMNKIGITEAYVESLIDAMPSGTEQEADAKALARIVFRNQQTFSRNNSLLATLVTAAELPEATVDAAWRAAEQVAW